MRPAIDETAFGSITIAGEVYAHDVVIRLSGDVKKRKKKLSKAKYGTSHTVSRDEAEHLFEAGAKRLILGSGQSGSVELSEGAAAYFRQHGCAVQLLPTPQAITVWNTATGAVIGMFHVTC